MSHAKTLAFIALILATPIANAQQGWGDNGYNPWNDNVPNNFGGYNNYNSPYGNQYSPNNLQNNQAIQQQQMMQQQQLYDNELDGNNYLGDIDNNQQLMFGNP